MADAAKQRARRRLILMVKEPRGGRVKTRLASDIGFAQALRFYRANTFSIIKRLSSDPRWQFVLAVAPDTALTSRAWPAHIPRVPQGGGDLGERMERLLKQRGPAASILIGSDIPGIRSVLIADAFDRLEERGFVLGPAGDGGYWLIGMRPYRPIAGLFDNVRWSTPHTLADTLKNIGENDAGFAAQLDDVDDAGSFRAIAPKGMCVTIAPGASGGH